MDIKNMIEQDTRTLALPAGRKVGQPGHTIACRYVRERMDEIGLVPFKGDSIELPYSSPHPETREQTEFINLAGVIPGTERGRAPVLIGAHYDSYLNHPSADDNATAVAVILAVAESLMGNQLGRDLIVVGFDAEEPPFFHSESMGSTRFYQDHCEGMQFKCAIIMDLIGHDVEPELSGADTLPSHIRDLLLIFGAESDASLPGIVEQAATTTDGLRIFPTLNSYVGLDMSDHHAFRLDNQPFLFLSCGQGRFYHEPEDTMDWINLEKVYRVYEFVQKLALAADRDRQDNIAAPHDPVEFEIRMIKKAIGQPLLDALGVSHLTSRADLDGLATSLKEVLER